MCFLAICMSYLEKNVYLDLPVFLLSFVLFCFYTGLHELFVYFWEQYLNKYRGSWDCTGVSDQDHLQVKEMQKAKMVLWRGLKIAEKREAKGKGEKERYAHLNAEFQRIARRDKKPFPLLPLLFLCTV